MKLKILIGAGGTGGHLFPAIAVVEEIQKQIPESEFYFVGRNDKIEGKVIPEKGYHFTPLKIQGITKLISLSTIKSLLSLKKAEKKIRSLIKKEKIDAVICTGAYISIPPGLASKKTNTPLFLMESNVNPGRAIKQLSANATNIFTSFSETINYFSERIKNKVILTGNPVRKEFYNNIEQKTAQKELGFSDNKPLILIFGGSLGATSINSVVENNIEHIASNANILWQIGKNYSISKKLPNNVNVIEFIDDMATAYAASNFIISRSGATTAAELCITGKPAILIPLKTSANNEQTHNAENLSKQTGLMYILNTKIEEELVPAVDYYLNNKDKLIDISKKLESIAKKDSAINIANYIINHIGNQNEQNI